MKVFVSVTLGAALALTGAARAQEKYSLSIATGGTGGVYYPLGGGMANILSKYVPGLQATAEVTGGSVDNLKLIATGKPYIGFSMADAGQDAYRGEDKFKGTKVPLRTLMVLYPNRMHVVTIDGIGITKMADLRGKRVSTGSPGSATEVMGFRVIEAAGLDKDRDMKRERLGVAESVNALKDRKIDAFFWVGGLPTAAVTDLANTPGIKIKLIDHAETVAAITSPPMLFCPDAASAFAACRRMVASRPSFVVTSVTFASGRCGAVMMLIFLSCPTMVRCSIRLWPWRQA